MNIINNNYYKIIDNNYFNNNDYNNYVDLNILSFEIKRHLNILQRIYSAVGHDIFKVLLLENTLKNMQFSSFSQITKIFPKKKKIK